jgi:hypothetical protein
MKDLCRLCDIDEDRPYRPIACETLPRLVPSEDPSDPYPIENSQMARKPQAFDAKVVDTATIGHVTLSWEPRFKHNASESHVLAPECDTIVSSMEWKPLLGASWKHPVFLSSNHH